MQVLEVNMNSVVTVWPLFNSLHAFCPGLQVLAGDIDPAVRTHAAFFSVWKKYGFTHEGFNLATFSIQPMRARRSPTSSLSARTNQQRRKQTATNYGPTGTSVRIRRPAIKKRRSNLEASRTPANRIERRVGILRKLLPNGESVELSVLFREAMEYIACLQTQVKVMKFMVESLVPEDSDY